MWQSIARRYGSLHLQKITSWDLNHLNIIYQQINLNWIKYDFKKLNILGNLNNSYHATSKLYCLPLSIPNRRQQENVMKFLFFFHQVNWIYRRQRRHVKSCRAFVDENLHCRKIVFKPSWILQRKTEIPYSYVIQELEYFHPFD